MSEMAMGIGTALSMLGVGAFFSASRKHITTLIPAFLGMPLFLLGVAAHKEDLAKGATLGATGLSFAGFLVSVQGLFFPQLFSETAVSRSEYPKRGAVQAITAVLCGTHVWLSVQSFRRTGQDS